MSAVLAANDSDELEALFDSVVAANAGPARADASPVAFPLPAAGDAERPAVLLAKIGQLTRTLHESLRDLGYDRMVEEAASSIPDARERLAYVATLTERAAQRVLNATDAARPLQDLLAAGAGDLAARWRKVFAAQASVEEFKALAAATVQFLDQVPVHTKATSDQLMEIVMAQDFQDLTGQVIKRINELAHQVERQLLQLLVEGTPAAQRPPGCNELLNGPVVNPERSGDVVRTQAQVDDLLESLGF
ncbi:MAG: protein phosphatase CheZ [Burkholderiales bacterium]|nr:protein phosphatase CheZ [Burkholderiales bacterium]